MKLKHYIKDCQLNIEVALAYENEYYYDKSGSKIYTSFFNGKVKDLTNDFLDLEVVKVFSSMFWGSNTYIIKVR